MIGEKLEENRINEELEKLMELERLSNEVISNEAVR